MPVYNERATLEEIVRLVRTVDLTVDPTGANPNLNGPIQVEREIILVDDGSTDGTREILLAWQKDPQPDMKIIFHEVNGGKGAALRTGFEHATGDIIVIQDADLEYDPRDYVKLLEPILEGRTPVVYGSRFLGGPRMAMSLSHTIGNKLLTLITNLFYGTSLSDMETCYKLMPADVVKSLKLRARRFDFERSWLRNSRTVSRLASTSSVPPAMNPAMSTRWNADTSSFGWIGVSIGIS